MDTDQTPHTAAGASEPYFDEAWALICIGERPSADKLVARLGGSKSIAVSALRAFWSKELPRRMQAQHVVAPTKIHEIAARLWTEAQKLARDEADEALARERAAVAADRVALDQARQTLAGREAELAAQLAAANSQAARLAGAEKQLRAHVETLEGSVADLRDQRDRLRTTVASLEDLVATKEAALGQLRTRNETALGGLQAAERSVTELRRDLAEAEKKLARLPELEQALAAARERTDSAVREAAATLVNQHKAALDAVKESHQNVVDNLLLQVDAARTETAKVRAAAASEEKALRQRISRLEAAAPKPPRAKLPGGKAKSP